MNKSPRCKLHPAYYADYCIPCGTTVPVSERHLLTRDEVDAVKAKADAARDLGKV